MKLIPVRRLSRLPQNSPGNETFKIRRLEDILQGADLTHDLHRHDFFFILAVRNGHGNHEIDFTNYNIVNNSVFLLRPGQVHRLQLNAGSTGYLLEFNTEFYHPKDQSSYRRLRKATTKNYCELETVRFDRLLDILDRLFYEHSSKEEGYIDIIKASLEIFFIEFARQSADPKDVGKLAQNYPLQRYEQFLELLEKHIVRHKQVSAYAGLMNLSSYQLNEITKSSVGKTASELINELILLEAKRHLLATSSQVKDIADQLGYEDPSYFIRFFKKHTGQSPEAFRQGSK